jgi:hypothetical protein
MKVAELKVGDQVLARVDGREKPATVREVRRTPRPRARTHVLVMLELANGHRVPLHPRLILRRVRGSSIRGGGSRGADAQMREEV